MAEQYARSIVFAALAEQRGLQNNPALSKEIDTELKLVRMRILASALLQNLQQQTSAATAAKVQSYYEEHRNQYERANVRRIWVPLLAPTESGRPLDHAAIQTEMEALRRRAMSGEDFNLLQQEAFKHLHIQATPPPVSIVLRQNNAQGEEATVFDLKPGEVSSVLKSPGGYTMFKLDSTEPVPLDSVRPEIEAALSRDRVQNAIGNLAKEISAEFDLKYLGLSSQPDIFASTAITPVASGGGRRTRAVRRSAVLPPGISQP